MNTYKQMQPVLLGWTQTLPVHWKIERLKFLLWERKESNNPIKTTEILSLTNTKGIIPYAQKGNIGNKSKENLEDYHLAHPGDLVVNSMNVVIGSVGISHYFGAISPVYYALVPREYINIKYCEYIFRLSIFEETLKGLGNGILDIRKRIPMTKLNNVLLPVPPRPEQDQIVRFLDWKVSSINKLINIKRKEINLLKIQRQRKLSSIITHGLKPGVSMKRTGIRWIGSIPAHWNCVPLKRCAKVKSGITLGKKYPANSNLIEVPYLRVANVQNGYVDLATVATLKVTSQETQQYQLPIGCVLMTEGGDRDKLGRGCVWNGEIKNCIHQNHIFAVTVNDKLLQNKWLEYVSASDVGRIYFDVTAIRTTNLACTNASKVLAFPIPLPPRDEQEVISNELYKILVNFDHVQIALENQIELLHELKNKFIADAVTGKIDVRGIEIPEYEFVEEEADSDADDEEETEGQEEG
ncbi:restriction endonuclease subunit S [Clostridiaceae bacterium]|nr:restriction endonuclease subunit S [Clostridiaceae bacterium]RKI12603.1 restriction endonuclease subunit S [bacterium 1XD21-70]